MARPLTVLATLTGSLLIVLALVLALSMGARSSDEEAIGEVPAPTTERAPSEPARSSTPAPEPEHETETAPEPAPLVAAPVSLSIPAIGVDADTVDVGLESDGGMEIPEDVSTVGWYELGVAPGEAGSAVVAGHVDSRTQGRGAFFDLRRLELDDTATVTHADGSTTAWRVTGRTSYPKDEAPLPELFGPGGTPQLTLITCGGEFDGGARSYAENVVVILEPA
ncbi:class F sortase [Nitriliruptor alkaliphilus]|uniref:class F sortase n=1 Tax=Nitriliruptor alkaliphilus TaxID=427918 RepID=UPI0006962C7D|nr:class F sortase [Nitriliruptor alkaliphilus]